MSTGSKYAVNEENLTLKEVLQKYSAGPQSGIFTDGSARPNPGPGGWGFVYVLNGEIITQDHGHDPETTNNRMELTALIEAFKHVDSKDALEIYSDSELCVKSMNEWASNWEKNGWRRKSGPIKNLELVQELYALHKAKPNIRLKWIAAHNGWLWNEYADSLSTAWARNQL